MQIPTSALGLLSLLAITGCDSDKQDGNGTGDRRAFVKADSWYTAGGYNSSATEIDRDQFGPVVPELQPEAQTALADVPFKQVTAAEATRLTGRPITPKEGAVHVLVRAVVLNEGTGRFLVGVKDGTLFVHHGSLGRGPAEMKRKALVVVLPALPERVSVSCSMAE